MIALLPVAFVLLFVLVVPVMLLAVAVVVKVVAAEVKFAVALYNDAVAFVFDALVAGLIQHAEEVEDVEGIHFLATAVSFFLLAPAVN